MNFVNWHCARNGKQFGPFTESQIKVVVIEPTDMVWREPWPEWKPASKVLNPPWINAYPGHTAEEEAILKALYDACRDNQFMIAAAQKVLNSTGE